jgi:hypothetical protein
MSSAPKPFLKVHDVWLLHVPGSDPAKPQTIEILKIDVVTAESTKGVPPGFLVPIPPNPVPDTDSYAVTTFSGRYVGAFEGDGSQFSGYVWSGQRHEGSGVPEFRVIVMMQWGGPMKYGYFAAYSGVCTVADLHGSFIGSFCDNENNQGQMSLKSVHHKAHV